MRNKDKKANSFLALTISFIIIVTVSSALYKDLAEMDFPFLYQVFEILDQECLLSDNDSFNKLGLTFFSPPLSQPTSSLAEKPSYSFFETPSPNQQTLVLRCQYDLPDIPFLTLSSISWLDSQAKKDLLNSDPGNTKQVPTTILIGEKGGEKDDQKSTGGVVGYRCCSGLYPTNLCR